MYHRNYTTYLQKELDFLKILVDRFHEQENVNELELDIALLKTQEIYEQFLRMKLGIEDSKKAVPDKIDDIPVVVKDKKLPEQVKQTEPAPKEQPPVSFPVKEKTKTEPVEQKYSAPEKETEIILEYEQPEEPSVIPEEKKQQPKLVSEPKSGILAEKIIPANFNPINETLAQKTGDLSSKLQTSPLNSIVAGIGLNDKFLYIRELFKGDNALYSNTVRHMDTAGSLSEAMDFIEHHFDWDKKDETVQKFINLVHRRHGN